MADELNLQPIVGLNASFNPVTRNLHETVQYKPIDTARALQSSGLEDAVEKWRKALEERNKQNILRGRLDAEAGVRREVSKQDLQGYRVGYEFQLVQQGMQAELAQHAKDYQAATLAGADEATRRGIYQRAVDRIGQGITESELPEPYKQHMRKLALDNLDVMFKAQKQADKVYAERKYDEITAGNAVSLRHALTAAAGAGDANAAATALRNAFQTQIAAEYTIGNDKSARKEASQRTIHVLNSLLQNFDPQDPQQVAARNLMLRTAPAALEGVLDVQEYGKLQDLIHKADNNIRDFNGVQAGMQVEQFRRDILAGQFKSTQELQGLIDSTVAAARAGQLSPADALQRVRDIGNLQELQKRQQQEGKSPLEEIQRLNSMTAVQAEFEFGSTEKWEKAVVQAALGQHNGDLVKAGWQVFEVARANQKDDLTRKGIDMFSRAIQYSLNNHDPKTFAEASGNATAESAFAVWKQAWQNTLENQRWDLQDQLSNALGKNGAVAIQVLAQNPNATLADVIASVHQWKSVSGFDRQKHITEAADALTADQFLPARRWTNYDTVGTSKHSWNPFYGIHLKRSNPDTDSIAQMYRSNANAVLRSKAGSYVLQNQTASNADGAVALLTGSGNIVTNSIGSIVLSDAVRDKLTAVGETKGITQVAEILKHYQVKFGEGEPQNVFVDGMWNSDKLRFVVVKDGQQTQRFVSYDEVGREFLKQQDSLRQKAQRSFTGGTPYGVPLNLTGAVKELKAMQTKAVPKAVPQAVPKPASPPRSTPQGLQRHLTGARAAQTAQVAPQAQTASAPSLNAKSAQRSAKQILQDEIATEKRALENARKGLDPQGKPLKGNAAAIIKDRELNIQSLTRELSRR